MRKLGVLLGIVGVGFVSLTVLSFNGASSPIPVTGASFSANEGWSCGDFPCEGDLDGWLERLRVPEGFSIAHVGQFKGQVQQMVLAQDGALYATVLENGTRYGAVYRLNADKTTTRYSNALASPFGLAFHPTTGVLYVSSRLTPLEGGMIWRILPDGQAEVVRDDLPCCYMEIENQVNGLFFGDDGFLYVGVGSLTDRAESSSPRTRAYDELLPNEANVLRINPETGELTVFASRIRNPQDITQDSTGNFYATDRGTASGIGDRLLALKDGAQYGFPFYGNRGCEDCPPNLGAGISEPDVLSFEAYTLPMGLVAYTGTQFPSNFLDTLFVALWNTGRVLWVNPSTVPPESVPFVTGLLRPSDVLIAPDGTLWVSDWLYGHVWRVRYEGASGVFASPTPASLFVTSTPNP